ncbi:uncharacterized protein LOC134842489 isoform X1 [Symsagittifera roscoffensis]|uniref:uncharacterized protein LOC134842489 isoform X1 n=1 Tax=Symsagittifera roscoffensis TaxID=84072 RepID=UPI00307C7F1C
MEVDLDDVLSLLQNLQLQINETIAVLDLDATSPHGVSRERIRKELARLFAEQISSKQSLNRDCAQNDISNQQKISSYPDFRLWLKSIDIRQTLSISLESNFASLESVCDTPAAQIRAIASKCGASDAEIETLFIGLDILKAALHESKSSLHLKLQTTCSIDSRQRERDGSSTILQRSASVEHPPLTNEIYPEKISAICKSQQHLHKKYPLERPGDASDDGYYTSVEKSPGPPHFLPVRIPHRIGHKFVAKKFVAIPNIGICGVCAKFLITGVKCQDCRFKCHKKCQLNAPASCGLHEERESKLVEQSNHHTTPFISPTTLTSATISNFSSRTLGGRLFDKSDPKANSLPRKGEMDPKLKRSLETKSGSSTWSPKSVSTPAFRPVATISSHFVPQGAILQSGCGDGVGMGNESTFSSRHAITTESSADSCSSSSMGLSGTDFASPTGTGPAGSSMNLGQPRSVRNISTSTGVSSDISSVESSPCPVNPPSANSGGCPTYSHIFNFTHTDRDLITKSECGQEGCLSVPPPSGAHHHRYFDSLPSFVSSCSASAAAVKSTLHLRGRGASADDDRILISATNTSHSGTLVSGPATTPHSTYEVDSLLLQPSESNLKEAASNNTISSPASSVATSTIASSQHVDSEGVTVSRSSQNTSTTLTDSENAANGATSSFRDRWSIGESFDKRIDDDYDEIMSLQDVKIDKLIGHGRFASVYRGYWHGEVAVKVYNLPDASGDVCNNLTSTSATGSSNNANKIQITKDAHQATTRGSIIGRSSNSLSDARRRSTTPHDTDIIMKDIKTLCKARHNNIVLFMAACRDPQTPAIITSLCKGKTLYRKIHQTRDEMPMPTIVTILEQTAQGMGYLHGRAIVHKDLRTNNLFVDERNHVIITDYGLANITKVVQNSHSGELGIFCPPGWLSSLAPELVTVLSPHWNIDQMLPFTMETDVYAFGVVCFELFSGRFLHEHVSCHSVIWSVASGCKNSLASFQSSKRFKDFLMRCWSFNPDNRPLFSTIHSYVHSLEKEVQRIRQPVGRTPSQPINMSRSMERMNAHIGPQAAVY